MKRPAAGLPIALCAFFLLSSCFSLSKPAARLELAKFHDPKVEILSLENVPEDSTLGKNIKNLLSSPTLEKTDFDIAADMYFMKDKDKSGRSAGNILHNRAKNTFNINMPVVQTKPGEIIKIIEDNSNKIAKVFYTVIYDPIEPYYSRLCIDASCRFSGEGLKKTGTANMYLKQVQGGWRPDR